MMRFLIFARCSLITAIRLIFFYKALDHVLNPPIRESEDIEDDNSIYCILCVPYYSKQSIKFAKQLSSIISKKFNIDMKIVYSTFKVKNYFRLKCRTPLHLLSNVVYKYECAENAQVSYIGYTKRHLISRVAEHTVPSKAKNSHVYAHIENCVSCKARKPEVCNFKVMQRCKDETDCKIAEAFAIKKNRPVINKQLFAQGSSLILRVWK